MTTINERLSLIIKELRLNNNSFAKAIGVNPVVTFNIIEGRKTKPSFDLLQKILITFDNINAQWLITGKGNKFITNTDSLFHKDDQNSRDNIGILLSNQEQLITAIADQIKTNNLINTEMLKHLSKKK